MKLCPIVETNMLQYEQNWDLEYNQFIKCMWAMEGRHKNIVFILFIKYKGSLYSLSYVKQWD